MKVNNKLNLVRGDLKEFKKVFQRVERNAPSYATKSVIYTKYFKNLTYALANEIGFGVELVFKELNHLAAILHVYAGGLNFMK